MESIAVIEKEVSDVVLYAENITITDAESNDQADQFLIGVKALQKKVKDTFDPIVKKAKDTHTEACNQKNKHLDPLLEAEKTAKNKMGDWFKLCEAEKARLQAEIDAKAKAEKDALDKQKAEAVASGDLQAAANLEKQANEVIATKVNVQTEEKKKGASAPIKVWKTRIKDEALIPRDYLMANEKKINDMVVASSGSLIIPGVENYQDVVIRAGRG